MTVRALALSVLVGLRAVAAPSPPVDDQGLADRLQSAADRLAPTGGTLTNWDGALGPRTAQRELPRPGRRSRSASGIARRASDSVLIVGAFHLCDRCHRLHPNTASGFVATRDGVLVTSLHVLATVEANGRALVAVARDGTVHAVTGIVAADPATDLVALQLAGGPFEPLPLGEAPDPGDPVHVLSHPEGRFFTFTSGQVSRTFLDTRHQPPLAWLSITADFARGSSGAPVLDAHGNAVGVVNHTQSLYHSVEKDRQENLQMVVHNCTPAAAVRRLLTGR